MTKAACYRWYILDPSGTRISEVVKFGPYTFPPAIILDGMEAHLLDSNKVCAALDTEAMLQEVLSHGADTRR